MEENKEILLYKVGSDSNEHKVSEAVYRAYLEGKKLEIQAIGGGAINQAIKGLIGARGKLAVTGKDIAFVMGWRDVANDRKKNPGDPDTISAVNFRIVELS